MAKKEELHSIAPVELPFIGPCISLAMTNTFWWLQQLLERVTVENEARIECCYSYEYSLFARVQGTSSEFDKLREQGKVQFHIIKEIQRF